MHFEEANHEPGIPFAKLPVGELAFHQRIHPRKSISGAFYVRIL